MTIEDSRQVRLHGETGSALQMQLQALRLSASKLWVEIRDAAGERIFWAPVHLVDVARGDGGDPVLRLTAGVTMVVERQKGNGAEAPKPSQKSPRIYTRRVCG